MEYTNKITHNNGNGGKTPIQGVQGEQAIWEGPLSQEGRPHKPGNSRGPNGLQVLKYPTPYEYKAITEVAKRGRYHEDYL